MQLKIVCYKTDYFLPHLAESLFQTRLVHRFVNNYTNRVGCGFECAGIKTQA
mgnify:FL=1